MKELWCGLMQAPAKAVGSSTALARGRPQSCARHLGHAQLLAAKAVRGQEVGRINRLGVPEGALVVAGS